MEIIVPKIRMVWMRTIFFFSFQLCVFNALCAISTLLVYSLDWIVLPFFFSSETLLCTYLLRWKKNICSNDILLLAELDYSITYNNICMGILWLQWERYTLANVKNYVPETRAVVNCNTYMNRKSDSLQVHLNENVHISYILLQTDREIGYGYKLEWSKTTPWKQNNNVVDHADTQTHTHRLCYTIQTLT